MAEMIPDTLRASSTCYNRLLAQHLAVAGLRCLTATTFHRWVVRCGVDSQSGHPVQAPRETRKVTRCGRQLAPSTPLALRRAFLCKRLQSALSTSDRTPAAILRPVWACTLKGCRTKPRREPPIRALAPMP